MAKELRDEDEKTQAYHLRYRIFCEELKWVPPTADLMEKDDYDDHAIFLGLLDRQNRLVAFIRIILPDIPFMLEKEFLSLVNPIYRLRKEDDTAEISRLCIAPEVRKEVISGFFGRYTLSMLLYKSVYHWSIRNQIRYLYMVVEDRIYRLLHARGFPCRLIGDPKMMPDGVIAVAAILDWEEFEILNRVKRPAMWGWFNQYRSDQVPSQLQQPEPYLQHQVFS